ncbi:MULTISPECIES: ABC transporter substrate-binding protein [Brevibacillus]|uniref:ABC transporter substrate-binding protein n=1 Tax=Brevibacillus invocatus TaxID=173959 RepID=A0A3M8CJV9_9BACL|nr:MULTISPECIES: ABC transporter substrate-binding protein [Brevibacillus]MDH4615801.1 ABC transporter substrate-binding protein [Brevibacillus sp. AY1]RNB75607.1 ABC transporter substrate-binding protein [Brevibacillus invocatus]
MKRLLSLGMAIGLVGMAILSGCSSAPEKIRIGEVTRSLFYAPLYVALEKGFFQEEGLDVELSTIPGGDKVMSALLSDGIDVALVGSETSIYVAQQGAADPVINFAQLTQTDGTFLVAREKTDSFSFDQLKGTVFLGQRKGGMPQMVGEYVLKKHQINPQSDLELIQNIEFKNIAASFASGTGKYVQLFEPEASRFEQEGIGHVVASFGKESGTVPYTVFMTKQSTIDKNPTAIQKFTNAVYKGQQWVASHSPKETADTIAKYFEQIKPEIMESAVKRYLEQGSYATDPILDEAEWKQLQDIMDSAGELKGPADYAKLVNTTFAKAAIEGK